MNFPETIVTQWETLTNSIAAFEYQLEDYKEYCNASAVAQPIKCVGVNDEDTPSSLAEKLGAVLGHVLTNCVTGFGHKWAEHYARLQQSLITADFEWEPLGGPGNRPGNRETPGPNPLPTTSTTTSTTTS